MSYNPTNWTDGTTPLDASNMNKIEDALSDQDSRISDLESGSVRFKSTYISLSSSASTEEREEFLNKLDNPTVLFNYKNLFCYSIIVQDNIGINPIGGGSVGIFGYTYGNDNYGSQIWLKFGSSNGLRFRRKNAGVWTDMELISSI